MKKILLFNLLFLFLFVAFNKAYAQDIEGGIFLGITEYQGDLTEDHVTFNQTKISIGALGRYYLGPRFNLRAGVTFGQMSGTDVKSDEYERRKRNLHFKTNLWDIGVKGEFNILPFVSGSRKHKLSPYVVFGVSVAHVNPKAENKQGEWVKLQPLETEGVSYSLWQVAIPYGIGVKYSFAEYRLWNIGLEFIQNKTFTDYLDDVSNKYGDLSKMSKESREMSYRTGEVMPQKVPGDINSITGKGRGNPDKNDMYFFIGVTLTKTFRSYACSGF